MAKTKPTTPPGAEQRMDDETIVKATISLAAAHAAMAAAFNVAPSITDLGRSLAAISAADAIWQDGVRQTGHEGVARGWAIPCTMGREAALHDLIAMAPATSLADCAVQLATVVYLTDKIRNHDEQNEANAAKIEQMALGALPHVAAAAGLSLKVMGWEYLAEMGKFRFGLATLPTPGGGADAKLLAACARYQPLAAEQYEVMTLLNDVVPNQETPEDKAREARLDELNELCDGVMREIAAIPARTPEGLRAKAEAIYTVHSGTPDEDVTAGTSTPYTLMEWSLVLDVTGRAAA